MNDTDYFEYADGGVILNDAAHIRAWAKANRERYDLMPRWTPQNTDYRVHIHVNAEQYSKMMQRVQEVFLRFAQQINAWFPNGVTAALEQRAEAKRVHTAYRRKKGKHW